MEAAFPDGDERIRNNNIDENITFSFYYYVVQIPLAHQAKKITTYLNKIKF
jgi:hypothetical protein